MTKVVARIRLARGESGYYDDVSGICLNWNHPTAEVLLGTDCSGLRTSLKAHRIELLAGSLGTPKTFKQVLMEAKAKRTGEDLKTLMGNTPLAADPTEVINDDTVSNQIPKPTSTIDAQGPDKNTPKVETAPAKKQAAAVQADEPVAEEADAEDSTKETVGDMTVKPGSIRKLKIGSTREITSTTEIVSAESSNEKAATVTFEGKKAVVTGVAVGNTVITLKDAVNGEGIVETTVVKA